MRAQVSARGGLLNAPYHPSVALPLSPRHPPPPLLISAAGLQHCAMLSFFSYILDDSPEYDPHTTCPCLVEHSMFRDHLLSHHRHKARVAKPYTLPKATLKGARH